MSTAKTSSAIATHLESAITSIGEVNSAISGIYSSVMGRDDARITGIDTRMSLKQELKNNVDLIADGDEQEPWIRENSVYIFLDSHPATVRTRI